MERLDDGEVSPYLAQEARPGDLMEVRGPIGGYFVWEPAFGGPLLLAAGGSGIVPLRSMLRARSRAGSDVPVRLLYSSRSWEDVIYASELDFPGEGVQVIHALTRSQPPAWSRWAVAAAWRARWPSSPCGCTACLGIVVRCRDCEAVLMTFVRIRGVTRVDLEGLASLG